MFELRRDLEDDGALKAGAVVVDECVCQRHHGLLLRLGKSYHISNDAEIGLATDVN